jgi:hypothetical protein
MRLALALALSIPGILLLATEVRLLGLLLIVAGWWVYERSGLRQGDGLITFLTVAGGLGVLLMFAEAAWQALQRL